MTRLAWNKTGERYFETGVDRGVLYPSAAAGVAWNGLTSVSENPSGGEPTPYYMDGVKYLNVPAPEEYTGSIEAFTYPNEFAQCDGTLDTQYGFSAHHQPRKSFGLSYRTRLGNDIDGEQHGYKIHLLYNALASPTQKSYSTVSDNLEAMAFSWGLTTIPIILVGYKPTAHLTISSKDISNSLLTRIEEHLYGSSTLAPALITPAELITLFTNSLTLLEIYPNPVTGMAELREAGIEDLQGDTDGGLYTAPTGTRLTATAKPGQYTLE